MYCSECGQRLPESAKFCPQCGTAAERDESSGKVQVTSPPPARVPAPTPPLPPKPTAPPQRPAMVQGGGRSSRNWKIATIAVAIIGLLIIGYFFSGASGPEQEAAIQQWLTAVGFFYHGYFQIEKEFEVVNQNPRTTHQEAVKAWTKLVRDLQGMQDQLDRLQPPPKVAREDAADMAQIRQLWSDLLAVEIQMGQQLLQYSQQGQKPPNEFLQGTLPQLWQTKNKQLQDQQPILVRLVVRHRVSVVNSNTPNRIICKRFQKTLPCT